MQIKLFMGRAKVNGTRAGRYYKLKLHDFKPTKKEPILDLGWINEIGTFICQTASMGTSVDNVKSTMAAKASTDAKFKKLEDLHEKIVKTYKLVQEYHRVMKGSGSEPTLDQWKKIQVAVNTEDVFPMSDSEFKRVML